ncbi:MAG TPA: hypothetical protein VM925_21070 [Labilithrix sp.]|nr:hypothetical protein [Labilithrix sp.]
MGRRSVLPSLLFVTAASLFACSAGSSEPTAGEDAITSNDAKILDFTFEGEVVARRTVDARKAVVAQLMYAQGILTTARNGNGHVGNVKLTDVTETENGATKRIRYRASLPVAWPKAVPVPASYELTLPLDSTAFDAFNAKYDKHCGAKAYGLETFWHDWNPKPSRTCTIDEADVRRSVASVAPHVQETTNKYPEYDEIWKDDRLDVVAIFGIITSNVSYDLGYNQARKFTENSTSKLTGPSVTDNAPSPSVLKDTTVTGKVMIGGRERDVKVDVLVVNELEHVGSDFDRRYDALTEKADMILYNGHAGLGKNINALARKGKVTAGKYQLVLLNGCQSFAYIDTTMTDRRREANGPADPLGTKFLDVMGNALPGYASNLASMSNTLYDAAIGADAPKNFNEVMRSMPPDHIVAVFGEEDNAFER